MYPIKDEIGREKGEVHHTDKQENEELIWEEFKKGSQTALTYIYRNYANALFSYGCQFCSNKELVRDTVQDLFIDIIHSRSRLGRTTSVKFYLFKSLRNKILRVLKKQQNNLAGDNIPTNSFKVSLSPEHLLIRSQLDEEKRSLLENTLNQLPPLQKEALLLYFYEGMSYQQIAEILQIKTKSVRALVYRSIDSLGKLVKPFRDKLWLLLLLKLFIQV